MKMKLLGCALVLCLLILFVGGLIFVSSRHSPYYGVGLGLEKFKSKAKAGDAYSAWLVYKYYSLEKHDDNAADEWLNRAAKLGYAGAQRWVAYEIRRYNRSYQEFGQTPQLAVMDLLEKASKSSPNACRELGDAYADGYFGAVDLTKARACYQQAASMGDSMAWRTMAEYCHRGTGGLKDEPTAYYWISLEARCVHPQSISGKETWQLRNEIAAFLTRSQFEEEWKRIDAYIAEVRSGKVTLSSPPFLKGHIKRQESEEGERVADQLETEHRAQTLKRLGATP